VEEHGTLFADVIPVAFRGGMGSYGGVGSRGGPGSRGSRGVRGVHRSRGGQGSRGGSGSRGGLGLRGRGGGLASLGRKLGALHGGGMDEPLKMKRKLNIRQQQQKCRDYPEAGVLHACQRCRKSFSKRHYLLRHVRRMHPPSDQLPGASNENEDLGGQSTEEESKPWVGQEKGQVDDEFDRDNDVNETRFVSRGGRQLAVYRRANDDQRLEAVQERLEMEDVDVYDQSLRTSVDYDGIQTPTRGRNYVEMDDLSRVESRLLYAPGKAYNPVPYSTSAATKSPVNLTENADPNFSHNVYGKASTSNGWERNRWGGVVEGGRGSSSEDDTMSDDSCEERGLVIDMGGGSHSSREGNARLVKKTAACSATISSSSSSGGGLPLSVYTSNLIEQTAGHPDPGNLTSHAPRNEFVFSRIEIPPGNPNAEGFSTTAHYTCEKYDSLSRSTVDNVNDSQHMQSRVTQEATHTCLALVSLNAAGSMSPAGGSAMVAGRYIVDKYAVEPS